MLLLALELTDLQKDDQQYGRQVDTFSCVGRRILPSSNGQMDFFYHCWHVVGILSERAS